jgi:ParB-like nuclease domain
MSDPTPNPKPPGLVAAERQLAAERPDPLDLNTLTFHPLAEMFPLISDEELKELAKDIRENGMLEPIMMYQDKILDGRNRYRALMMLGKTLVARSFFRELTCTVDPKAYVISENIRRRHLTAEQKREIVASLLRADPSKSNRAIAATAKVDDKTVAAVRGGLETGAEIPHQTERVGKDGKKQSGSKKGSKETAPHVAYKRKQEELIDLLKETHTSFGQAAEWVDSTKQRLDETLTAIGQELDDKAA